MKNILIACYSHLYMPTTLSVIFERPTDNYFIMTDNNSIRDFFMNSSLNVKIIFQPFTSFRLSQYFFINKYKRELLEYVNSLKITTVYFFHDGECMPFNWLLSKICRNVKIYYIPVYKDYLEEVKRPTLRQIYRSVKTYVFWKVKVKYLQDRVNNQYFYDTYLHNIGAETIDINIDTTNIKNNISYLFPSITNIKNKVLIIQSEHVGTIIEEDAYVGLINEIINDIGLDNCVFKGKPNWEKSYGLEKKCFQIPSYISGNLIVDQFKCCIGTTSAMLSEAANAGVSTICLLNVLPTMNISEKNRFLRYLHDISSENLQFPDSRDELFQIIHKLKLME